MNQRIKELAEQSVSRFDKDMDGSMEPTENGRWVYYDDLTEFAELIVRECCDIADEVERADTGMFASKYIRAHFGVRE